MARRLVLLAILPLALVLGLSVVLIGGDDCEDGAYANPGTLSPEAERAIPHDIAEIYVSMARRWNIDVAFLASIGAQETDHGRSPTTTEVNGSGCRASCSSASAARVATTGVATSATATTTGACSSPTSGTTSARALAACRATRVPRPPVARRPPTTRPPATTTAPVPPAA